MNCLIIVITLKEKEEKNPMNKKIVLISSLCVMVVLLAGFTPALATKTKSSATVPIEVTRYIEKKPIQTIVPVSFTDAVQIKQCLIELYNAQERNDQNTISKCITVLKKNGIVLDKRDQTLVSTQNIVPQWSKMSFPRLPSASSGDNLSNTVCFFNAIGQGMVYGTLALKFIQAITKILQNQTNPFLAIILLLALLPLLLTVILINDLVPFRILMPAGVLVLANGSVSSIGLLGLKRMKVGATPIQVNLSWFTGLTINIPPLSNASKPFVFTSGFALKAEGVVTS
jgi:hypothetical protein